MNPETAFSEKQPALTVVKKNPAPEPPADVDLLADKIRSLEQWYATDFERRIASIRELLRDGITEELRAQFNVELGQREQRIREEYEERLYVKVGEWATQQAVLQKEIEDLKLKVPTGDLVGEIASVETAVNRYTSANTAGPEGQPPTPALLSRTLQGKIEEIEMRAYLRGLKFRT